jgi:two-component system chemotaxis response regulator CheB
VEAPGIPVIMCSAYTERGAQSTLDALAAGAKDYVMKPSSQSDFASALDTLMQQLLPKIAARTGARTGRVGQQREGSRWITSQGQERIKLVVVGVSTGGPSALEFVLPQLPKDFAVPVLVVQHMPKLFTGALAARLDRLCALHVREAYDGAEVRPGTIWLAPGDAHLEVVMCAGSLTTRLHHERPLNSCKPSVDYLFQSAARAVGAGALGLVMTGMGADGLDGARAVKREGGTIFVQDQASSAVWGMPGRVTEAGLADQILPLDLIASGLQERVRGGTCDLGQRSVLSTPLRQEVLHGLL